MNIKQLSKLVLSILFTQSLSAQEIIPPSNIQWYTLDKAVELAKENPRPIMLDVYTDWCTWCKFLMKTTFANQGIADYINNNFYAARFNAETFDTVSYQGKKFFNRRIGSRPSHDLSAILLDGKLSYPSIVFFDREGNKTIVPGYKEPKDIEPFLVYFAENINKTGSLNDFYINFMHAYPDSYEKDHSIFKIDPKLKPDTLGKIEWIRPENLEKIQKKKGRMAFVFFYTNWSIGSKVMERTSFRNRELATFVNSNSYPIKIDAATNDTIEFLGKKYFGTGVNQPHQIAYALLNKNFQMPSLVVLDDKNNIIGMINGYWSQNQLIPLFNYFFDNSYKNISFQDYLKNKMKNQ